jgi:inner membrane protein
LPTILSHPAVAIGFRRWFGCERNVFVAGIIGSMLPDADVIGFALGVPYASTFGHRGFTHSICFALIVSLILLLITRPQRRLSALAFLFLCTISHALFDAMTNGGLGIAFFSPFSNHRYFFPWRPIRVSPIGRASLHRMLPVFVSELKWVWLPMIALALVGARASRPQSSAVSAGDPNR